MKIVVKEIKKDGSESIIYLMDDNGNPLSADIVGEDKKELTINRLILENFTSNNWVNNKINVNEVVEEITYDEYINQ